jgi:hypothetical protein
MPQGCIAATPVTANPSHSDDRFFDGRLILGRTENPSIEGRVRGDLSLRAQ